MENVLSVRTSLAQSLEYNPENNVCYIQWVVVDGQHKNDPNVKHLKSQSKKSSRPLKKNCLNG